MNSSAGWEGRAYHTSVVLQDGSIVLMGGLRSDPMKLFNDVWRSSDNGVTWIRMNTSAGWLERYGHSSITMPDGSIILMGGAKTIGDLNDVWRSTDHGETWTEVTRSADWSARANQGAVVLSDGSIILFGGNTYGIFLNDTWRSIDYGKTWTNVNTGPGWSPRDLFTSLAMPDGSIVLIGGESHVFMNDIWWLIPTRSSNSLTSVMRTEGEALVPDFNTNITYGAAPLTVAFTDLSTGSPARWEWDFGEDNRTWSSTGSLLRNPVHTFVNPGNYTVTLKISSRGNQ